ncbi:MAG: transporter substrate-binding protein [Rubritepida sp.]|nr:transporter substrate-binding protein [Rubritepida sp.]
MFDFMGPGGRRRFLTAASTLPVFAIGRAASAQQTRQIRIADTSALHEMSAYAIPEFLGPQYTSRQFNFGASGTSIVAAMMNGMCDAMSNANSYLVNARSEGAKLVCVCGVAGKGQAILARTDRGISRFEDLRGKKLVTRSMTSSHVMMQIALRAVGIDPKRDVTITDCGQPVGFTLAMERDSDAGQIWEPFASIAASRPNIRKLELDRFFDLTWRTHRSLFVAQKLIDEEPQVVRDLVAANILAVRACKEDRAKYLQIATRRAGQPPDVLNAAIDNCDPRIEMDTTMFYRMAEEMRELGMVRNDVARDLQDSVNYTILSEITGRTPEQLGFVSYDDYKAGKRAAIQ